jgi:hypothetical protein
MVRRARVRSFVDFLVALLFVLLVVLGLRVHFALMFGALLQLHRASGLIGGVVCQSTGANPREEHRKCPRHVSTFVPRPAAFAFVLAFLKVRGHHNTNQK